MRGVVGPVPVHLMGGTHRPSARRGYRRARRLRRDRRGVVAVIGTLLALLVFFALFGIFLTQYVPLWMTDNEAQLSSETAASYANLKESVDLQYTLAGPPSLGTSFTISSAGVPLLAQPTQGTLVFLPTTCPNGFYNPGTSLVKANWGQPVNPAYCVFQNLTLSFGGASGGVPTGIFYTQHVASGVLEMVLPNRYFTPQTFYYEDDAVVQSQGGLQQILLLPPPLNVTTSAGNTSASTSFLQLYGNASTVIGQGAQQVFSHLRYSQAVSSLGRSGANHGTVFNLTYEIGTQYPCAWQRFFQSMMNGSGAPFSAGGRAYPTTYYNWTASLVRSPVETIPVAPAACTNTNGLTTVLTLRLTNISFVTAFYAGVQLSLGIGGT